MKPRDVLLRKVADYPGVSIEVDDAPICSTLGLVLNQSRLGFFVKPDGSLVIVKCDNQDIGEEDTVFDAVDLARGYQNTLYSLFFQRLYHPAW